jgi:hypothetical protein
MQNIVKDHAGHLRDEIHETNQCMKNQHKVVKDEYITRPIKSALLC